MRQYLILHNVSKFRNCGMLIRAAAFGVEKVFIIGDKKNLKTFGDQGTKKFVEFCCFDSLALLKDHLTSQGITICGIEILDQAQPVTMRPFKGPTAFMPGNEGVGLLPKQIDACDHFVYIPQYSKATASLNVAVAGSIVFHHFAEWAGLQEAAREGSKYCLGRHHYSLEAFKSPTMEERELIEKKREERARKKRQLVTEITEKKETT